MILAPRPIRFAKCGLHSFRHDYSAIGHRAATIFILSCSTSRRLLSCKYSSISRNLAIRSRPLVRPYACSGPRTFRTSESSVTRSGATLWLDDCASSNASDMLSRRTANQMRAYDHCDDLYVATEVGDMVEPGFEPSVKSQIKEQSRSISRHITLPEVQTRIPASLMIGIQCLNSASTKARVSCGLRRSGTAPIAKSRSLTWGLAMIFCRR